MAREAPVDMDNLSDAEIDDLVDEATGGETGSTEPPEDDPSASDAESADETQEGTEPSVESSEGEEDEEEQAEEDPTTSQAATKAAQQAKGKPFTFKASGAEHTFQGVEELNDGSLRVSKEATPQFKGVLASYVELRRTSTDERRKLTRELETARKERSDKDLEAEAVLKLFDDIEKMTPEQRWMWAEEFGDKVPALKNELEIKRRDREIERLKKQASGEPATEEEARERRTTAVQGEVKASFQRLFADPDAKALTEQDRKELLEKWLKKGDRLVVKLEKDDPTTGGKKGQEIFDDADIVDDFLERIRLRKEAAGTLTAAQKNARQNADQQGGRGIPPTVRSRTPSSGGKKKVPDLRGRKKEFGKQFLKGELDTDADDE